MNRIKIRDWPLHFERDRTRQWQTLRWVPIPNKQGSGYRKIMAQKDGLKIFACWIALIQLGSLCSPRGDLSKYTIEDISLLTLIPINELNMAINYLSKSIDWIEVITPIDTTVNILDSSASQTTFDSSVLFNSIPNKKEVSLKELPSCHRKTRSAAYTDEFEAFWALYPKKVAKAEAFRAWMKIPKSEITNILQRCSTALDWQKKLHDWTKENGQFIPYPATYINKRRWEDEPAGASKPRNPTPTSNYRPASYCGDEAQ